MLGSRLVGTSAYLQTVDVDGLVGEYVEGAWNLTDDGPVWNPTPFIKILRWQSDAMIFQLVGGIELTRDDLITLAASLR